MKLDLRGRIRLPFVGKKEGETLVCRYDGEKTTNMRMFWKRRLAGPAGYEPVALTVKLMARMPSCISLRKDTILV